MTVLLVDDDLAELDINAFALRRDGFTVLQAPDESLAVALLERERPDVMVVGFELVSGGSCELMPRVRALDGTSVLITVGRDVIQDWLRCFELGGSDFIARPFVCEELALRIQAILVRSARAGRGRSAASDVGGLRLDPETRTVSRGPQEVRLTPTEFRICAALFSNAGRVVPANHLLAFVTGSEGGAASSLRSHICHLRQKLDLRGGRHGSIDSVPAVGYLFTPSAPADDAGRAPIQLRPAGVAS